MKKIFRKVFGNSRSAIFAMERNGWHAVYKRPVFLRLIRLERDRVHRNEMYFSLILFKITSNDVEKGYLDKLIRRLKNRVRKIDLIGWYNDEHLGVLLPETPFSGARVVTRDICKAQDGERFPIEFETITYPSSDKSIKRRDFNG